MDSLLNEIQTVLLQVQTKIKSLSLSIGNKELPTHKGISLLEVKQHAMLTYLTHLCMYMMLKLTGQSIENHPIIDRLIEERVHLERIRPMEEKLRYQIDKLLKAVHMHEDNSLVDNQLINPIDHPLAFKPNVDNFDSEEEEVQEEKEDGVYRPPKLAPAFFAETSTSKAVKVTERAKERAAKSRLLHELKAQYDERPEEFTADGTGYGSRNVGHALDEKLSERQKYEEANFVRLPVSKEDKKIQSMMEKRGAIVRYQNEFSNLQSDFHSISGLADLVQEEDQQLHGKSGILRKRSVGASKRVRDADEAISSLGHSIKKHMGHQNKFRGELKKAKKIQRKSRGQNVSQ